MFLLQMGESNHAKNSNPQMVRRNRSRIRMQTYQERKSVDNNTEINRKGCLSGNGFHSCQRYLLNEIMKYIGKRMGVRK